MPQFLLSVWHDDNYEVDFSTPEAQQRVALVGAFNQELLAAGALALGAGLLPTSSAKVVRSSEGNVTIVDGPYAQTNVQMGGFWMIEAIDVDAALAWAAKGAAACGSPVEVRPAQG